MELIISNSNPSPIYEQIASQIKAATKVNDEMLKIYGGQVSVDEGLKNCNDIINQAIAEG